MHSTLIVKFPFFTAFQNQKMSNIFPSSLNLNLHDHANAPSEIKMEPLHVP